MMNDKERIRILIDIATQVVQENVNLSVPDNGVSREMDTDNVYNYACEVLSLGPLFRVQRCHKRRRWWACNEDMEVSTAFKTSGRTNYSIEALTLLSQYYLISIHTFHMDKSACTHNSTYIHNYCWQTTHFCQNLQIWTFDNIPSLSFHNI